MYFFFPDASVCHQVEGWHAQRDIAQKPPAAILENQSSNQDKRFPMLMLAIPAHVWMEGKSTAQDISGVRQGPIKNEIARIKTNHQF